MWERGPCGYLGNNVPGKDSRSRYGVDMGAHLVCSRNIREASVVEVEETRERVADELREALGAKPP